MAWKVFYSYSHKDSELREKLGTYLAPLKHQDKIVEWHDRDIEPGADWDTEISSRLESAHMIILLVSADFLASDYCFGVEVEKALSRLKRGEVKVVPVLLKPCLWEESRFSELQIIPRDAKAITSWGSADEAFKSVASEIRDIVSEPPPSSASPEGDFHSQRRFDASLDLVREQVRAYARLYERTRQRMRPSHVRTRRMEEIFQKMRGISNACFPLLDELASSPSPGERLAAVAILQVFSSEKSLPFLVKLIGTEKPFVGYHATRALHIAVGSLDPNFYPQLLESIKEAQSALDAATVGFDTDRQKMLRTAEEELRETIDALSAASTRND